MVFAEYYHPKFDSTMRVEYTPSDQLYMVKEYHKNKLTKDYEKTFYDTSKYLEYIDQLRKCGYTRRNIFNGKN